MGTPNERAGQKVRVQVPAAADTDLDRAYETAQDALQAACERVGCAATDITMLSREPWTEPVGGVGPYPDMNLLTYEATAARQDIAL